MGDEHVRSAARSRDQGDFDMRADMRVTGAPMATSSDCPWPQHDRGSPATCAVGELARPGADVRRA